MNSPWPYEDIIAITFGFYNDSGLTQTAAAVTALQATDGTAPAADRVVYLGSTAAGRKLQAFSGQITVGLEDAATSGGVEASHVRLALTQAGLDAATPGAALSLGTQVLSGVGNAVAVWLRIDTPPLAAGTYEDVTLTTGLCAESAA